MERGELTRSRPGGLGKFEVPVDDGSGIHGQLELGKIILAGNAYPVGALSLVAQKRRGFGERSYLCATKIRKLWRGWYGKDDKGVIDERASKRKKKLTLLYPLKFLEITRDIFQMLRLEDS